MLFERRKERNFYQHWTNFASHIRQPKSIAFEELSDEERASIFTAHIGWDWVATQLREELVKVSHLDLFGTFNVQRRMENIKLFETAGPSITQAAPCLSKLLHDLDHPYWAKDQATESAFSPRHLLMFSMMCMSLHRKTCTNLPTSFGLYLFDGGATKRVIDSCNHLGICVSYSQLRIVYQNITKQAQEEVRRLGSSRMKLIVSYDNFEYQDSKAEERIASTTKFMSITTAVACVPCGLPSPDKKAALRNVLVKQNAIANATLFSLHAFEKRLLPERQIRQVRNMTGVPKCHGQPLYFRTPVVLSKKNIYTY